MSRNTNGSLYIKTAWPIFLSSFGAGYNLGNTVSIGRMSKIAILLFVALLVAVAVALPTTASQFQGKDENRKLLWKIKFRHFIVEDLR